MKTRWSERRLTIFGLGLGILIVASLSVFSYRTLLEQERHIDSVNHTHRVIQTIRSVLTSLKDAETGQRGYLLTQKARYLEPYYVAVSEIERKLQDLKVLTADNAEQQDRLKNLQSLVDQKFTELRETIELASRAHEAALQLVQTDEGQRIMDQIRSIAGTMEGAEQELLRVRSEQRRSSTALVHPTVLLGSLFALALLITAMGLVVRDSTAREQALLLQAQARLLDLAPVMIRESNGRVTTWNRGLEQLYGWTKNEAVGLISHSLLRTKFPHPLADIETELFQKGEWSGELTQTRQDGTEVVVASHWTLHRDKRQNPVAVVEVNQDMTERKRAEDLLQQANRQLIDRSAALAAANKELEAFSYSVSHDLRAPLRTMDGFSRILMEDHAPKLEPELQRCLGIVRKGALQMGRLIDDLLEFSRLGRHPLQMSAVNTGELVQEVWADFHAEREGRKVNLMIGHLPACEADRRLLKQVFVNLISNALKYTRRQEIADIEIGCREDGSPSGSPAFYVKDNGVGFNMEYVHKLFGVFQRLHRPEDFEGTGVGLAIVQRIIHRHGGTVWAQGEMNRGATFSFTLKGGLSDSRRH